MQKCYIEYLNQFELYLKYMSNNLLMVNYGNKNENEAYNDEEVYDDYELESYDDLEEENLYRQMTGASNKKNNSNTNDLELDNLSDLSDNFKIVPTSPIEKANNKFSKMEKTQSGDDFRRESLRKSSSKNKSENFSPNGSFKVAWM